MANKKNVIVGAARLFVADQYTTGGSPTAIVVPAAVAATPFTTTMAAATNWRDVGYTQDGLEISYEPTFDDVEVDQLLDSARVFKTSQRVMLNTTFAEATLENLLIVWAQRTGSLVYPATPPDATTGETATFTIEGGNLGESPIERQLVAVGNASESASLNGYYNERTYIAKRAISTDTSAFAVRRAEATVFPVSFRLLPDDTVTRAPYGTIRDRARTSAW